VDALWRTAWREIAVRGGFGALVIDARRGDGPRHRGHYTFLRVRHDSEKIDESPGTVARALRAVVAAQAALKRDPSLAAGHGEKHFPAAELALIAGLVGRGRALLRPDDFREAVDSLNAFARRPGCFPRRPAYDRVVATQFHRCGAGASSAPLLVGAGGIA